MIDIEVGDFVRFAKKGKAIYRVTNIDAEFTGHLKRISCEIKTCRGTSFTTSIDRIRRLSAAHEEDMILLEDQWGLLVRDRFIANENIKERAEMAIVVERPYHPQCKNVALDEMSINKINKEKGMNKLLRKLNGLKKNEEIKMEAVEKKEVHVSLVELIRKAFGKDGLGDRFFFEDIELKIDSEKAIAILKIAEGNFEIEGREEKDED